jgi:hypothetical protein
MAVTAFYYGPHFQSLYNKEIDFDSDTIKVMLCTSTYTPNQDTHRYKSDITNEVSGTGYTAAGATVSSPTIAYTGGTNVLNISGGNVSWASATFTARYAVVYDSTPASDATRPLIGYVDFGADQSPSNGTLAITWNAGGIATVTVS